MKTNLRHLLVSAIALATALLATSCSKTPAPEAFTAQLENIDGAMAFYSLQHPKLIAQSLAKLTAAIPEAAYLNLALAAYGGQAGYPEFTDISPNTNIGLYVPLMSLDELQHGHPTAILFIKLKENGKIWNLLTRQLHLKTRKLGDWTMFAENPDDFDAVKNPDAITTRLSTPQAENLRAWFSLDGDTAASFQTLLDGAISGALAQSRLAAPEKTALTAYAKILLSEFFASAQSARATLNLGDNSIQITGGIQNKPDSPIGVFARYRSDATPDTARYIANDALISGVFRITPKAQRDLIEHFAARLLEVDYPPVSAPIAKIKNAYDTSGYWKQTDGCVALTMNMSMDLTNPQSPKSEAKTFSVASGNFDAGARQVFDTSFAAAQNLLDALMATIMRDIPDEDAPAFTFPSAPPVKIEGQDFSAWTMEIRHGDKLLQTQTTYYGVAGGNLVTATNKTDLQTRLPALLAKKPQPDNLYTANPLQPYDIASMSLNGAALADMACDIAKIDMTDTDAQAVMADIKESYKQTPSARVTVEARQAALSYKADIPYQFIAASAKLGRYIYSAKNTSNW